jgi:N-acetyl sugar amidotransferase
MDKRITIPGNKIYLRSLTIEDASAEYCSWLNDPEVNQYLETRKSTIEELKSYIHKQIEDPNSIFVGIFDSHNDVHIGNIKLEPINWNEKTAVLGILIGNKYYWGKGIGTEATSIFVDYAFTSLKLNAIKLGVIPENKGAIKVYEKVGFKSVETRRGVINHDGKIFDDLVMEIKPENRQKNTSILKRCTKCTLPETHETIFFNEQGVCNVCSQSEYKTEKIDWMGKKKELDELIEKYKGKGTYDCIIPFSGGKDSTWTLYYLVKNYNLKPLVVQFDHGFMRPNLRQNNEKTFKRLGVDSLSFRPNWQVVKKLMLESLKRKGDFCWHCHTGIFAYPMQIAVKYNIPLVFWGEPSAEYTSYYSYEQPEEVDEKRFNRFVNLGITAEDMVGMLDGAVTQRDLEPFRYPNLKNLRSIGYRSVCLGSYIPWDVKKQVAIIKDELGWQGDIVEGVPPEYDYEKIECAMQGVRDYLKFIKRGFARVTHLTSIDIRNGRLARDKAMELINKYEGKRPASLDVFLEALDLTEEEFNQIAVSHVISPHKPEFQNIKKGEKLPDQEAWNKD